MTPDPSSGSVLSDPSEDPPGGAAGSAFKYPDDFEEFWRVFPGSTDGKREALKAWKKLTSVEKATAIADLPLRLAANWAGKETDKIPRASTYLNQKRWEDDLQANRIPAPAPGSAARIARLGKGMRQLAEMYDEAVRDEEGSVDRGADQGQGDLVSTTCRRVDESGVG